MNVNIRNDLPPNVVYSSLITIAIELILYSIEQCLHNFSIALIIIKLCVRQVRFISFIRMSVFNLW
jgi:hypothetical protein